MLGVQKQGHLVESICERPQGHSQVFQAGGAAFLNGQVLITASGKGRKHSLHAGAAALGRWSFQ